MRVGFLSVHLGSNHQHNYFSMTHTKVNKALGLHVAIPTKEVALHPNKAIDGDKPTLVASIKHRISILLK